MAADQPAEKLIKIDAKVVSRGRYVTFQIAEVAVVADIRGNPVADCPAASTATAGVRRRVRCDAKLSLECRQGSQSSVIQRLGSVSRLVPPQAAHALCDLPLPKPPDAAILVPQAPGSRGLSVQIFRLRFGHP